MNFKYKIQLSENRSYDVEVSDDGHFLLNGKPAELDAVKTGENIWNVLHQNKSYNVKLVSLDISSKALVLSINDEEINISVHTPLDELLAQMGMSEEATSKMVDVRAPMPGLVLKVMVDVGSKVKAGDALIILEAMKMENVIKSTGDGTIAEILVSNQDAVEKNQILMEME